MTEKPLPIQVVEAHLTHPWSPSVLNKVASQLASFELETTADFEEYVSHYLPARIVLLMSSWNLPKLKVLRARYESLAVGLSQNSKEQQKSGSKGMVEEREAKKDYLVDHNLIKGVDEFINLAATLSFEGCCSLFDRIIKDPATKQSLARVRGLSEFVVTTYNNTIAEKISRLYDRMSQVDIMQLGIGSNWLKDTPQGITWAALKPDPSDPAFVLLMTSEEARKADPELAYNRAQQEQECLMQMKILTKMVGDLESTHSLPSKAN